MKQFPVSDGERVQIEALVANLRRSLSALRDDIRTEEERVGIADVADPTYPMLAHHLRARHQNISTTIKALRAKLPQNVESANA